MKKVHTNKGFTLAELLIVVAVIAVLVGIAIPTFMDQLEKARESTDVSNIREAYSEIVVALSDGTLTNGTGTTKDTIKLLGGKTATLTVTAANPDATPPTPAKKEVAIASFDFKQEVFDSTDGKKSWAIGAPDIAGIKLATPKAKTENTLTFTFTEETGTSGTARYYLSAVAFS